MIVTSFLYLLEELRTPFLSSLISLLTQLGSEVVFMAVAIVLYWCVDKKKGLTVLCAGFIGIFTCELAKLIFRVPRPWVRDPSFSIVESARAGATGYSFPSGHTVNASVYSGSLFLQTKKTALRTLYVVLAAVVAFSRLYLGVHTPADVAAGLAVGLAAAFAAWALFRRYSSRPRFRYMILGAMLLLSVLYVVCLHSLRWPADTDAAIRASAVKNSWTLVGCSAAMLIAVFADDRRLRFRTKAPFAGQVLKAVIGLAITVALRMVLKQPLNALFGGSGVATAVRYFIMVLFAGAVWPLTFPLWEKVGKRKREIQ